MEQAEIREPETAPDGMTLAQKCPKCGKTNLVLTGACCKYARRGWEIMKKCPYLCGFVERVL